MNIFIHCHGYPPAHNAGAEYYLHTLAKAMVVREHTCKVITKPGMLGSFTGWLDGVDVQTDPPPNVVEDAYGWAHVVITHLDWTRKVVEMCKRLRKPLVYIVHNPWALKHHKLRPTDVDLVVFNAHWLAEEQNWAGPQCVIPPAVWAADYEVAETGDAVTLCNLNVNKGGDMFWSFAKALPHLKFLGVKGYGEQVIRGPLPNVTILENQPEIKTVFERTRLLLMPSEFESFGRLALEAGAAGIPTIANPTPGLREAMGDAAVWVSRKRPLEWLDTVQRLMIDEETWTQVSASARARAYAQNPEAIADVFEEQLWRTVQTRNRVQAAFPTWTVLAGPADGDAPRPAYSFVIPFSRPWSVGPWFDAFDALDIPRSDTQLLVLIDTVDHGFEKNVMERLAAYYDGAAAAPAGNVGGGAEAAGGAGGARRCIFDSIEVHCTGRTPLPERGDVSARRDRVIDNWKRILPRVQGTVIMGAEDDTLPPPHAYRRLMQVKRERRAVFVQGTAVGRWSVHLIPHWQIEVAAVEMPGGAAVGDVTSILSGEWPAPADVIPIQGGGWYCFVADADAFRMTPMRISAKPPMGPDVAHVFDMVRAGGAAFGVTDVKCTHFGNGWRLHPDDGEVQRYASRLRGRRWVSELMAVHFNGDMRKVDPSGMVISGGKTNPENQRTISVRATHTWMGEEGHICRGQELLVSPRRLKFLKSQSRGRGWVEVLDPVQLAAEANKGQAESGIAAVQALLSRTPNASKGEQLAAFMDPKETKIGGPAEAPSVGPAESPVVGPVEVPIQIPAAPRGPGPGPEETKGGAAGADVGGGVGANDAGADTEAPPAPMLPAVELPIEIPPVDKTPDPSTLDMSFFTPSEGEGPDDGVPVGVGAAVEGTCHKCQRTFKDLPKHMSGFHGVRPKVEAEAAE